MATKRFDVKSILADAELRRHLMVSTIQTTQAREGIETTREQADRAYTVVAESEKATAFSLRAFRGNATAPDRREEMFVRGVRGESDVRTVVRRADFQFIEGAPLIFDSIALVGHLFRENAQLGNKITSHQGVTSRDDARFVRYWWEVSPRKSTRPWVTFFKGGEFSRFYSDALLVIDWSDEAQRLFWRRRDPAIYFKPGLTWPRANHVFNVRRLPADAVFADKGPALFPMSGLSSDVLLGLLNSEVVWFLMTLLNKYDHWEMRSLDLMPLPEISADVEQALSSGAREIHDAKASWDTANELCTRFSTPWLARTNQVEAPSVSDALDRLARCEAEEDARIQRAYRDLNRVAFAAYGIADAHRGFIETRLGERPNEVVWQQMAGKSAVQKRMEHVWRLLSYVVMRVMEADDDGIVPFTHVAGDVGLVDRVRQELIAVFPGREEGELEVEIVNELKRSVRRYRRCQNLGEWLENAFFEYHASIYRARPIYWHIASSQGISPAFSAVVNYHRFDKNRMAKLRSTYVRDAIEELRREVGIAAKAGRAEDRTELQAKLEEVQALDKKLQQIQEGHHEGAEGGERDFRILTPWKDAAKRPRGWAPDLDDGVKVNIAPFERAGVLRVRGVVG